jgi:hypothetical protein
VQERIKDKSRVIEKEIKQIRDEWTRKKERANQEALGEYT